MFSLEKRHRSFSSVSIDHKAICCNHCSNLTISSVQHSCYPREKPEWKGNHRTAAPDSLQDLIQRFRSALQDSPWVLHLPELIAPLPSLKVFITNCTISVPYHNNVIFNNTLCSLWVWQWLTHNLSESYFYIYPPLPVLYTPTQFLI